MYMGQKVRTKGGGQRQRQRTEVYSSTVREWAWARAPAGCRTAIITVRTDRPAGGTAQVVSCSRLFHLPVFSKFFFVTTISLPLRNGSPELQYTRQYRVYSVPTPPPLPSPLHRRQAFSLETHLRLYCTRVLVQYSTVPACPPAQQEPFCSRSLSRPFQLLR